MMLIDTNTVITSAVFLLAFTNMAYASPALTTRANNAVEIEHRTLDEIYQAALQESRTLTVAWGGDSESLSNDYISLLTHLSHVVQASQTLIISSFHNRFPGIHLNLTSDLSKRWDSAIDIAHSLSNGSFNGVDVAVLQSFHDFPRWKDEGRLLNYKVREWDDIYPEFVDEDGAYTGLYIFSLGSLIYSRFFLSLLPESQRHLSLPSLLTPPLSTHLSSGLISLTYPNDDDAVLYLFSSLVSRYGWEVIHSLVRQNVTWVRGTATAAMLIANDYTSSSFNSGAHRNSESRAYLKSLPRPILSFATEPAFAPTGSLLTSTSQQPITYTSPYITWPQTGSIFRTTHNPETSKLFISYLLSSSHQLTMNTSGFATRRSFDTKGVFKQMPLMDGRGYQKFMLDREDVERWRLEFEEILGLPKGENPNDIDF